MRFMLINLTRV